MNTRTPNKGNLEDQLKGISPENIVQHVRELGLEARSTFYHVMLGNPFEKGEFIGIAILEKAAKSPSEQLGFVRKENIQLTPKEVELLEGAKKLEKELYGEWNTLTHTYWKKHDDEESDIRRGQMEEFYGQIRDFFIYINDRLRDLETHVYERHVNMTERPLPTLAEIEGLFQEWRTQYTWHTKKMEIMLKR